MFQSVRRAVVQGVEKTWNTLAAHTGEGRGDHVWDDETDLYKRDILMNSQLLGENYDVEVRIEAIRKIGHLAYTGKQDAAKLAGMFLERMIKYYQDASAPPPLRLQVVKSLPELCRSHRDNTNIIIDMEIPQDLLEKLRNVTDFRSVRWNCYTLVSLCSISLVILKIVQSQSEDETLKNSLALISDLSWKAWPRNYAIVLLELIGFRRPAEVEDGSVG